MLIDCVPGLAALFRRVGGFVCVAGCIVAAGAADKDDWLKVVAPEFTVITTLREKEATAQAAEFSQFIAALRGFIDVKPHRLPRLTLVVFARERDFAALRPLGQDGRTREVAGFFSRRESWAVAGLAGSRWSDETRAILFHEGTHWFLSAFELPNPVWLEEGLAEVFSTFALDGKNVSWGKPIESHVEVLRLLQPMPLEQLLFVGHDQMHDAASLHVGITYAQSWVFVHYLVFGQRSVPKGALIDYVKRLRTTVHPDEAFRQAFGAGYADVDRKLHEYLQSGRYFVARHPPVELAPLKAEPASQVEVQDALARLRMVGGRYAEAQENVARLLAASPEEPRYHELQGELAQEVDDLPAALAAYRAAAARGSRDFRPYYELAAAEHRAGDEDGGMQPSLRAERARGIANGYERAINLNPRFRPAYQGLAGVVNVVPAGNQEDARFLEFGLKLFPDDGMIRLGLAAIAKREGNSGRAKELLAEVMRDVAAQPPSVALFAQQLETEWVNRDVFGRVEELSKQRKFGEALAVVDEQVAAGADFATRQRLKSLRDTLVGSHLLEQANHALVERRWEEARTKFREILESSAPIILKTQVRRQLEQLDKRALPTGK